MRTIFEAELRSLGTDLVTMSTRVESAIAAAGVALLTPDLTVAESVITDDLAIDALQSELDERCVLILAKQQPVASDLRTVVSALRMSASLERMGDLARHIAAVARLRFPASAIPADLATTYKELNEAAVRVSSRVTAMLDAHDLVLAAQIEEDDDELDSLHLATFAHLLHPEASWTPQQTIDITLTARYYERFGDHAVSVARRMVYLVTGETTGDMTP